MATTVFFSWQSDHPTKEGRNFIERALKTALERIARDLSVEEPLREIQLDKDTLGVAGSPPIFDTILTKINNAAIFVPDLTFVAQRTNGDPIPNPNVLIEYGYALKALGHTRIIAVMNTAHGKPKRDTMPFDLAHHKFPIQYEVADGAPDEERRAQREQLAKTLESAIRAVLDSQEYKDSLPKPEPPPPVKYREPQDGRARFWLKGEPVGYIHNPMKMFLGQPDEPGRIADGPAIWLRLMPQHPITRQLKIDQIKELVVQLIHAPLYASNSNTLQFRGAQGAGLCMPLTGEPSSSLVHVFTDAEIWAIDTYQFRALPKLISLEERALSETMRLFAKFLSETLQIPPPYRWVVGIEGIKGRSLPGPNYGLRGPCLADIIEHDGTFNSGDDPAILLEPFFAEVFEQCGVTRPAKPRSTEQSAP